MQFFENGETRAPRCFLASAVRSEERVSERRALCLSEYLAEEVPAQPLEDRGQQEVVESDRLRSQVDGIVSGKGLCFPFSPNNGHPDHLAIHGRNNAFENRHAATYLAMEQEHKCGCIRAIRVKRVTNILKEAWSIRLEVIFRSSTDILAVSTNLSRK